MSPPKALRARQRLGKYRIEKRLADGGFATVYRAYDTIEGIRVALKIPQASLMTDALLEDFRNEVRMTAKLDHPHILQLKNASFIDDRFVIAFPLGEKSLTERLKKRMSLSTALELGDQLIDAVAYAHSHRIIHCDIKPDNIIMFPGSRVKLTDFGIAKVAMKKLRGSGTGTVGYMAPEQAMGRPTLRSDVFSVGLILYRMLSGSWPEYPFDWPPPGIAKLRKRVSADFVSFLERSIALSARNRYKDASRMQAVFRRLKQKALRQAARRRAKR